MAFTESPVVKRDQNKPKCIASMDKIKRKLDVLGVNSIITRDKENILCKFDSSWKLSNNDIKSCPAVTSNASCCSHSTCTLPIQCELHRNNGNNSNDENTTTESNTISSDDSLFRIVPTDIYDGLFLHVIKLHGEVCELKMSFDYSDEGITELIDVLLFLV